MMNISTNTIAQVSYKIHTDDKNGELIEFADDDSPKSLIFGNNSIIPGLETHMDGLEPGSEFEFTLNPDEAFGSYRDNLIVDVPKSAFEINGELKEDLLYLGNQISMMTSNGSPMSGRVMEITSDNVKMNFNHILADKSLYIVGKVLDVRVVTEQDLAPAGGCGSGCGCSSPEDNQSDSCCSTGESHEHAYEDDCPSCGNSAELRGKGHGNCGCS